MGYQPRSPYYEMYEKAKKEIHQLRYANDELVAEVHRIRQDGRLDIEANSAEQLARDVEDAENSLWSAQDKLALEKAYTKGFATMVLLSTPAAVILFWGAVVSEGLMTAVTTAFGFAFGLSALISILVVLTKMFGAIPEVKREVARTQLVLDRAQLRQMGIK